MSTDASVSLRPPLHLGTGPFVSLGGVVPADARQRWTPAREGRWLPMHCYLLLGGTRPVMVDTSVTVFRESIADGLRGLGVDQDMDVVMTRYNFDTLINLPWLRSTFSVDQIFSSNLAEYVLGTKVAMSFMDAFEDAHVEAHLDSITEVRPAPMPQDQDTLIGSRLMRCVRTPIRLLTTNWVFDYETRALFSSDMWAFGTVDDPERPPVITSPDEIDADDILQGLLFRFDFLRGVNTDGARADIARLFDDLPIEMICPSHGAVIQGRAAVDKVAELTDSILADLKKAPPHLVMKKFTQFPTSIVSADEIGVAQ